MARKIAEAPSREPVEAFNPLTLITMTGTTPSFDFAWKEPGKKKGEHIPEQRRKKRRIIGLPNKGMRQLHRLFQDCLKQAIWNMGKDNNNKDNYTLRKLISSTGCVEGSNHYLNANRHLGNRFFYITDFADAYPSLDLRRLTTLLVFIFKYEEYRLDYGLRHFARNELAQYAMESDSLFPKMESFVKFAFGGKAAIGLAVGGNLSPYLLNLYCEVYLDSRVRDYCEKTKDHYHPEKEIVYTRFVDDLVWSSNTLISSDRRRELRRYITEAGFSVNHMKSKVLDRTMGKVPVTKVGLEKKDGKDIISFPQKKRRRIEGIMRSYLVKPFQNDSPETIRSMIAEFLYYVKLVTPTESDKRTLALCKKFQKASDQYRHRYPEKEKEPERRKH